MIFSWIRAARPKTLALAFASILMGNAVAESFGYANRTILMLCLLTALSLQILSNFANDYGDFVKGTDALDRIGPERQLQSGQISKRQMRFAIIISAGMSLGLGIYLSIYALQGSLTVWLFMGLGLMAVLAAITYTIGKNAYGYKALGDVFVFLFFGLLAVLGTYFLIAQKWNPIVFFPAIFMGCFAVGVLNINNMRDIENDRKAGKQTLPTIIGLKKAKIYHAFLIITGMLCLVAFDFLNKNSGNNLMYLVIVPLASLHLNKIFRSHGEQFNPLLAQLSIFSLIIVLVWYFCH